MISKVFSSAHGLTGVHGVFSNQEPPCSVHSVCVVVLQTLLELQHAPKVGLGPTQILEEHGNPLNHVPPAEEQACSVVSWQVLSGLQHEPKQFDGDGHIETQRTEEAEQLVVFGNQLFLPLSPKASHCGLV